jgi:hypothetical protein
MVDFRQNPAYESESGTDTEVVVSDSTMAQYPAHRRAFSFHVVFHHLFSYHPILA